VGHYADFSGAGKRFNKVITLNNALFGDATQLFQHSI
jgi:hypothetical protein